jgi:hypothetical protein
MPEVDADEVIDPALEKRLASAIVKKIFLAYEKGLYAEKPSWG